MFNVSVGRRLIVSVHDSTRRTVKVFVMSLALAGRKY
jgi:hypothetical protein